MDRKTYSWENKANKIRKLGEAFKIKMMAIFEENPEDIYIWKIILKLKHS